MDGTSFVGREDELAQLTALLSHNRLVTVTGTGGVGKTRLALEAARRVRHRFPGGAYVTALSALADPALLPNAVAAALGLAAPDTVSVSDSVIDYLRDRKILLILDTCEHLLDACSTLAETLLLAAPAVTVLATSRQPLDVTGEVVCPLSPMSVPEPGSRPVPGDAVHFFVQRAPRFTLTDQNAAEVIELCRRLDGIPLALELAAARVHSLPLRDLAMMGLARKIAVPSGGRRGRDSRHQTMEAAIAWSHGLCTRAEQVLWERLSVFAGPFEVSAAEEVCAGDELPAGDVLTTIVSLVDKSVLQRDAPAGAEGQGRYRMLDAIREFGARRLDDSGDTARVQHRLIAHCTVRAQEFGARLLGEEQVPRFRGLRAEQDSIRAALGYALNEGAPDEYARLATSLSWYWHVGGQYHEGLYWTDQVLDLFPDDSEPGAALQRAVALIARCALGATGGQPAQAVADGREAIALARRAGLEPVATQALLHLTVALSMTGDYDGALKAADQARRGLEAGNDRLGLVILSLYLTNLYQLKGDYQRSLEWYQRSAGMLKLPGERWLTGWLHLTGGYVFFFLDEDDQCAAALRRAVSAKHEIGDVAGVAFALEGLAIVETRAGRHERGAWLTGAAGSLWDRAGTRLADNVVMKEIADDFIATARMRLGPVRHDEVFARGARASRDQAVAFAVSDSAELPGQQAEEKPGASGLSGREREIALLAGAGLTNREIAEQLVISRRTVDSHMAHIYAKLGLSSRAELARWRQPAD